MEENIEFERCIEFLVRMIEKYGKDFLSKQTREENAVEKGIDISPIVNCEND